MDKIIYIAKKDTWFDEGTKVVLIDDYRNAELPLPCGLFAGTTNGIYDEEICGFEEFEQIEVEDCEQPLPALMGV